MTAGHDVGDVAVVLACDCGWTVGILVDADGPSAEAEARRQWADHAESEDVAARFERERLAAYVEARRRQP